MLLTTEQVKRFAHGYLHLTEEDGWLFFHRYTPVQEQYYLRPEHVRCPYDTTGVRLECTTDATELSFTYRYTNGTIPYYCFDLYVDGVLNTALGRRWDSADPYTEERRLAFTLPKGTKKLSLWLPQLGYTKLKNVTLTDATVLEWTSYEKTYLAIGDSITHGSAAFHPANTFPARLARAWGVELYNQGLGGDVHHVENLGQGIGLRPDYVTVMLGCNDWFNRTPERHREICSLYYLRLAQLFCDSKIAVLTPLWNRQAHKTQKAGTIDALREVILQEAQKYPNITVIHGQDLLPQDPDLLFDDFHPSDKGFATIAQNLKPRLEKIFNL